MSDLLQEKAIALFQQKTGNRALNRWRITGIYTALINTTRILLSLNTNCRYQLNFCHLSSFHFIHVQIFTVKFQIFS